MSNFDWAPFAVGSSDNWRFEKHGDNVVGTVRAIRGYDFGDGKGATPILSVESDEGVTKDVIAGNVNLRRQIAERNVQVGDRIAISYDSDERLPGRPQPMKVYTVAVKKAETSGGVAAADLL